MKKQEEKNLTESILALAKIVKELRSKRYLQMADNPRKLLFYSFLLGAARGIGFAVGVSVIFALLLWLLSQMTLIPLLGNWIAGILDYLEKTRVY